MLILVLNVPLGTILRVLASCTGNFVGNTSDMSSVDTSDMSDWSCPTRHVRLVISALVCILLNTNQAVAVRYAYLRP